jgi:hypothetical protein
MRRSVPSGALPKEKYMSINRRHFLINTGVAAVAGTLSAAGQNPAVKSAPEKLAGNLQNWTDVREQFDALAPDYIHLSSFFLASHPRPSARRLKNTAGRLTKIRFCSSKKTFMKCPGEFRHRSPNTRAESPKKWR